MAITPQDNQDSAENLPEPVKKKATRKRAPRKVVPSESTSQPIPDTVEAPKKKATRKRVAKKTEAVGDAAPPVQESTDSKAAEAPRQQSEANPSGEPSAESDASAAKGVRRVSGGRSGNQDRRDDQQNDNDSTDDGDGEGRNRKRRRRRRGGSRNRDEREGDGNDVGDNDSGKGKSDEAASSSPGRDSRYDGKVRVRQPESQPQSDRRPKGFEPEAGRHSECAWELFKNEIREEGGTLIEDRDVKKIAERAFRIAEIFLMEEARRG